MSSKSFRYSSLPPSSVDKLSTSIFTSLHSNLPPRRLPLQFLRHRHFQDPILQTGPDAILVDLAREAEAALKVPDGAFTDPVFILGGIFAAGFDFRAARLRLLLRLDLFVSASGGLGGRFVFGGGFVVAAAGATGVGLDGFFVALVGIAGVDEFMLGMAFDDERVFLDELNVNVFLLDSREFAVELKGCIVFAYVELGREGFRVGVSVATRSEFRRGVE